MTEPHYLITEELLRNYRRGTIIFEDIEEYARSHPYNEQADNIDEWCKLHEEVLKDIRTEAYRSGYHDGEKAEREKIYHQLMAASINNENPGWVQIAEIEKILNPFDEIIPDIENLQEFPFRSYPKKELRQGKVE